MQTHPAAPAAPSAAADAIAADAAMRASRKVLWMRRLATQSRDLQDQADALHYAGQYEAEVRAHADAIIGRATQLSAERVS